MTDRRKRLLDSGIILIDDEINLDMAKYVYEAIEHLWVNGNPDVDILIGSGGGDVDIGLYIFDIIDSYRGKTHGRVVTYARSMAAVILQACTTRSAGRHSKILIHHVSRKQVGLDTLVNKEKLEELIASMRKSQEKLYKILESRTGKSREEIIKACLSDTDMTAEEALSFGLISSITSSTPKEDEENIF